MALATLPLVALLASGAARAQDGAPPLPTTTPTESHATPAFGVSQPTTAIPIDKPAATGKTPPGTTPATDADAKTKSILTIEHADNIHSHGDVVELVGHVKLLYNGYTILADRATYNRETGVAILENNVSVTDGQQMLYADRIEVNQHEQTFTSTAARTILPPDYVGGSLQEPLRISGKTMRREGKNLVATDGLLTTCDFPNPHYQIGFAQATVIPNDRIVLRKAVFYRYERPIFRIEYLSLPIRDDVQYSYLPVVGRTDEEGYFIKNAVGYSLGKLFPGILRVDYMQKKGLGLGFDQAYRFGQKAAGTAIVYGLLDKSSGNDELTYHVNHQQIIGQTLTGVTSDYQRNNYLALSTQSLTQNTTISSTRVSGGSTTTANLTLGNNSQGGSYDSSGIVGTTLSSTSTGQTENYALSQSQKVGTTGNITFKFSGTNTSNSIGSSSIDATTGLPVTTTTTSGTITQNGTLAATGRSGIFDYNLSANKVIESKLTGTNSGTSTSLYSGPEKLPDLTLTTGSDRLKNLLLPGVFNVLPVQLSFGYGRYASQQSVAVETDGTSKTELQKVIAARSLFDATITPKPFELTPGNALSLQTDNEFKQTDYSKDYAQYVLRQNSTLTQKLGQDSSINMVYGYLRSYGATPTTFIFDQPGSLNSLGTNLAVTGARIKLQVGTGYDIQRARETSLGNERDPWQTVNTQLALNPSSILQTRISTSYDINSGRLTAADNRLRIRGQGGFAIDTDAVYDPTRKEISQLSATFVTPLFSRDLMLTALGGYSGITHQFSYKNFTLVRSFHDYEYVFSYHDQPYGFRVDRGFNVYIRLKAFPLSAGTPTSQYGGAVNLGTGQVF